MPDMKMHFTEVNMTNVNYAASQNDVTASDILKRMTDIIGALIGLLICGVLYAVLYLPLRLDGGRVIYPHTRIGKNGKPFHCYKFRSMRNDADQILDGCIGNDENARSEWMAKQKLKRDPRLTKIGAFLRKWSIDECPQFYNILVGDMSLVGPRPVTRGELQLYGPYKTAYKSVQPGLTGLWQVSGRNDLSYEDRVKLDTIYVHNRNWFIDMGIILKTILVVITRKGAY